MTDRKLPYGGGAMPQSAETSHALAGASQQGALGYAGVSDGLGEGLGEGYHPVEGGLLAGKVSSEISISRPFPVISGRCV